MRNISISGDRQRHERQLTRGTGVASATITRRRAQSFTAQRIVTTVVSLVVLGNAAIIVWLWLRGGGVSAVHGTGEAFTSFGRITGLLAAYLLLIQILLLARLPFAEQLAGFDGLTIWHRRNGKLCLYLIVAHVVFITIGYAGMDKFSVPSEISTLLSSYPGMVTATVGTGLLILVAVSSFIIVRQRLRYEAWYVVHLLSYAGIVLAWFHQIPTGNEFAANTEAAAYWTALYVGTLGLMVLSRFARPAFRASWYRMRVSEVIHERSVMLERPRHPVPLHHERMGELLGREPADARAP